MNDDRLTKQGLRDLNAVGHNGHKNHGTTCRHWFAGPRIVIGTRWAVDHDYLDTYEEPVYGTKCMWCTAVEGER